MGGDLEELPRLLVELRGLVKEAHAANKDLARGLREYRQAAAAGAEAAREAARSAAHEELEKFARHLQGEMNAAAADLNTAINVAREHIVRCLRPTEGHIGQDGLVAFSFKGDFDEDIPEDAALSRRNPRRRASQSPADDSLTGPVL